MIPKEDEGGRRRARATISSAGDELGHELSGGAQARRQHRDEHREDPQRPPGGRPEERRSSRPGPRPPPSPPARTRRAPAVQSTSTPGTAYCEARRQRRVRIVQGGDPRGDRRGTSARGRGAPPRRSPRASNASPRRALAPERLRPAGPRARAEDEARRARRAGSRARRSSAKRRARAGRGPSASRSSTGGRDRARCWRARRPRGRPATASGRHIAVQRKSGCRTRRRNRMIARPTSAPAATTRAPVRSQSTADRFRCSRRNVSGTRIEGRKDASRGPWKTAVRRGRASPMPAGFDSRTTVVSTRPGRCSVPTSRIAYSAAG